MIMQVLNLKAHISSSISTPTSTYNTATSSTYANNYGDLDPYCNMLPYFHCALMLIWGFVIIALMELTQTNTLVVQVVFFINAK